MDGVPASARGRAARALPWIAAIALPLALAAVGVYGWTHRASLEPPRPCHTARAQSLLGVKSLLVGADLDDGSALHLPLDLRAQYLTGPVADGPCDTCDACTASGVACQGEPGCGWWGCWQYGGAPPRAFAGAFAAEAISAGRTPFFTYYAWLTTSGAAEGDAEVAALQDRSRVARYLADVEGLAHALGALNAPVVVHLEPDLWGFAERTGRRPAELPVAMDGAPEPCRSLPPNLVGFAGCLFRLLDTHAPRAIGLLHASGWASGVDVFLSPRTDLDVEAIARRTGRFLRELGADRSPLVGVEMNHRDAGFNHEWWDDTDRSGRVAGFERWLRWTRAMADELGVAPVAWQLPYGHRGLPNRCGAYEDNRLDWTFAHLDRLAREGFLAVVFGAGDTCGTRPATDGGHFARALTHARARDWPVLCGSAP